MDFANLGIPPVVSETYPPWGGALVRVVDQALCIAWVRVRTKHPHLLKQADEDRITDQLKVELVAMRRNDEPRGFNSNLFGIPTRDSKLKDASGQSIDQTPDLTVYLARLRPGVADDQHDALFFECKVLDGKRGLALYCKEGIRRFVDGRYAWRMPHAGMVGYVLAGKNRCPVKSLTKHLAKSVGTSTAGAVLACVSGPEMTMPAPGIMAADVAETRHERQTKDGMRLGNIALRHLWLLA